MAAQLLACGIALIALCALLLLVGRYRFDREVVREMQAMRQRADFRPRPAYSADQLAGLPEPVQNYFRFALPEGREIIPYVKTKQRVKMRLKENSPWLPTRVEEHYSAVPPGFVWHAWVRLNPFVWFQVRDMYALGRGSVRVRILSLIPLGNDAGKGMDEGSLVRYLTEAVFFPTALLPSERLTWEAVDAHSAKAALTDSGVTVSAVFHFNRQGKITHATTWRYRSGIGMQKWTARYANYQEAGGMKIPFHASADWETENGPFTYAKLDIEEIIYEKAK